MIKLQTISDFWRLLIYEFILPKQFYMRAIAAQLFRIYSDNNLCLLCHAIGKSVSKEKKIEKTTVFFVAFCNELHIGFIEDIKPSNVQASDEFNYNC